MSATSTDQTYLVSIIAYGTPLAVYEVDAPNVTMAMHYAQSMAARDADAPASDMHVANVQNNPRPERACVICGTPESGVYTSWNRCCSNPDNMIEG